MPSANFSDTKYLVLIVKDGGEDSLHRFIPRSATRLGEIAPLRGTLAFTSVEVSGYTGGHIDADWCLHPSLNPLKVPLWDAGHMAITHRVGPMFSDMSGLSLSAARESTYTSSVSGIVFPIGLAAHDYQQGTVATGVPRDYTLNGVNYLWSGAAGFIGTLMNRFAPFTGSLGSPVGPPSTLPLSYGAGQPGFLRSGVGTTLTSRPLDLPEITKGYSRVGNVSSQQTSALARMDAIMALSYSEPRQNLWKQLNQITKDSVAFLQPVIEGANGAYTIDADFTAGVFQGFQGALRAVARAIEQRTTGVGLPRRAVFIINRNGYDTHTAQGKLAGVLPDLFADEAQAIVDFKEAMVRLGIWNNVVVSDISEFSRTLLENGSVGTDHAWARTYTTWGGAVRGLGVGGSTGHFGIPPTAYGICTYGSLTGGGSHDVNGDIVGGGALYPGLSTEQYWSPILTWFGADAADIAAVFPRRSVFGADVQLF